MGTQAGLSWGVLFLPPTRNFLLHFFLRSLRCDPGCPDLGTEPPRGLRPSPSLDEYEDESREIQDLLKSQQNSQKLEGLKRLIACISVGRDVSEFFPNVVVNVANTPFE
eukprot:1903694-Pyramimonas_sp.AAC.1